MMLYVGIAIYLITGGMLGWYFGYRVLIPVWMICSPIILLFILLEYLQDKTDKSKLLDK